MIAVEEFTRHRPLLFAIAYRMLGSVTDAEDVVQDAFLRWQGAVAGGERIESPKAWLSTVTTRLAIDHLRSARVLREEYVGPWLPEPLLAEREPDPADSAALAESLSLAFLVLMERLTPAERAAFLLHDIFGYGYGEIARIVGKGEAACRQLAHRARAHVAAGRPRFGATREQQERLTTSFVRACAEGDLGALVGTLAADVTLWSDGGGKVQAARKPIHGADKVAAFLLGIIRKAPAGFVTRPVQVNGQPGFVAEVDGQPFSVLALDIVDDRIAAVRIVVNPEKLRALARTDPGGTLTA